MLIQQQRLASASEHSWLLFDLATGLQGLPAFGYPCEGHVSETENSLGDSVTIATQLHWVPTTPSLHKPLFFAIPRNYFSQPMIPNIA